MQSASPWWRGDANGSESVDAWVRLSKRFSMPLPAQSSGQARVRQQIEFYRSNANILAVSLARAEPWVEHLLDELERRDLPGELFLVPIVESGFAPEATSPSRAAGIWQFMPATGAHFGLKQTADFDGRRDVFASTDAAFEYLESLHARFDDWALALAAYNFGQGNVARAIEANQQAGAPTDYWSLQLSPAAMNYVPKILALRHLIEARERHGIELPKPRPENAVVAMPIDAPIDLRRVATLTDTPLENLRNINPATRSTILRPSPGAKLALPRSALAALNATADTSNDLESARAALRVASVVAPDHNNSADTSSRPAAESPVATREIAVVAGDTLSAIAKRNNTTVASLKRDNALTSDNLRIGQRLTIRNGAPQATRPTAPTPRDYIVQPGDSLWSIAARHGVDLGELGEVNELARGAVLTPGQRLKLPDVASTELVTVVYLVQPGDTLSRVAQRHGVSLDALREHNHVPGDRLRSGETLIIPRRS
ncbi:MAG: LysM peptidoglycan-binding domain-containing protein [Thioalkalivibrionaceae bacterium]